MFDKNKIISQKLDTINNPVILELGVNRGRSTKRFRNPQRCCHVGRTAQG